MRKYVVTWTFIRHIHRQRQYKILTKIIIAENEYMADFFMLRDNDVHALFEQKYNHKLKSYTLIDSDIEPKPIYQKAIDTFGVPGQVDILIEEMAELTQALLKWRRGKDVMDNVHEEVADVEIMLAQIKTGLNLEIIGLYKNQKLVRLEKLIELHNK